MQDMWRKWNKNWGLISAERILEVVVLEIHVTLKEKQGREQFRKLCISFSWCFYYAADGRAYRKDKVMWKRGAEGREKEKDGAYCRGKKGQEMNERQVKWKHSPILTQG